MRHRGLPGPVSAGTYEEVHEKRDGVRSRSERTSTVDQNRPARAFEPRLNRQERPLRA